MSVLDELRTAAQRVPEHDNCIPVHFDLLDRAIAEIERLSRRVDALDGQVGDE